MAYLTRQDIEKIIQGAPAGTSPGGIIAALRQQGHTLEGYDDMIKESERPKNLGEKAAAVLGADKFGRGIGQTIYIATGGTRELEKAQNANLETASKLIKQIQENRKKGKDTTRLEKALQALTGSLKEGAYDIGQAGTGGLSNREVIGSAIQTGINVVGAGSFGKAAQGARSFTRLGSLPSVVGGASKSQGVIRGTLGGARAAVLPGAATGAASGVANEISSGRDLTAGGVFRSTIGGAVAGGVASGIIGGVAGGIGGALRGRAAQTTATKAALEAEQKTKIGGRQAVSSQIKSSLQRDPSLIAKYQLDDAGNVVKDKKAAELVRQGIDEKYVGVIKSAGAVDKNKMRQMVNLTERAVRNPLQVERGADIAGGTFLERVKYLKNVLKSAGAEVEKAATGLAGKKLNGASTLVQEFDNELAKAGVGRRPLFDKQGNEIGEALDFKGSDFENLGSIGKSIQNVYERLVRAGDNAHELHRLKRYIDEIVDYGTAGEGLKGSSQRLLKALRARTDGLLDTQFSSYNKANTKFRDSIQSLDEIGLLLGKHFNLSNVDSVFAQMRAGSVMRRITSNAPSRADILQSIKAIEMAAKKYGFKAKDDLITQVVFADVLEDVYGPQATTGLENLVRRGVQTAGENLLQGNTTSALIGAVKTGIEGARGINGDAKKKALKALLGMLN